MKFLDYLREHDIDPFSDDEDIDKELKKWQRDNDPIYDRLSSLPFSVPNDKLISAVRRITNNNNIRTRNLGTYVWDCMNKNKNKARKSREMADKNDIAILEKYLDSFVKLLYGKRKEKDSTVPDKR